MIIPCDNPNPLGWGLKMSRLLILWHPECHITFAIPFSHGFYHPNKAVCYLVEQRRLFLRNPPGCGIWYLLPSSVHSVCGSPRRNHCAREAGRVWVHICPWCESFASNGACKGSPSGTIAYTLIGLSMRLSVYAPYLRLWAPLDSRVR
jgi:hypothetical protein